MLTSRNRERERLQQEIEDLRLNHRRHNGVGSVAGDSIFERSISRAHQRPGSRASGTTRVSHISDEREEYEKRTAALRDEVAATKLINQELERELNAHLDILTRAEEENRNIKEEKDAIMEDLQAIQAEREEVIANLQEKEAEFEDLREEAIGTIDDLEKELEQKNKRLNRLGKDLENKAEDFAALQEEMKAISETVVQLEDDRDASHRRIKSLEEEMQDTNHELEALEEKLRDTASKKERLEVQSEGYQNEVSFLREEQEGDKIKIGELETNLAVTQERAKNVEDTLQEERRQHEMLSSEEQVEVQKVLNDLNSQLGKAKDEVKKLRKHLSAKEDEASTWKQRLDELENSLREALGDIHGTRASLLKVILANAHPSEHQLTFYRMPASCNHLSTRRLQHSTKPVERLQKRTASFVLAKRCWNLLVWSLADSRICSTKNDKRVRWSVTCLRPINVPTRPSNAVSNKPRPALSSSKPLVQKTGAKQNEWSSSSMRCSGSATTFFSHCGIVFLLYADKTGSEPTASSMAQSWRHPRSLPATSQASAKT